MVEMTKRWHSEEFPEPEIFPPGKPDPQGLRQQGGFETHTQHIYVRRIGPLGLITLTLMTGVIGALLFAFTLSAFLILLPVIGILMVIAFIMNWLRRPSHWPR